MGGKGTDASWILGELGYASLALGFAAGDTGRRMERMLQARGCGTDFTWVEGETRINTVIISEAGEGQSTLVCEGPPINKDDMRSFEKKYRAALKKADCILIGGSLPPGIKPTYYTGLVKQARATGRPVIFDANGPGLKPGMEGRPTIAKPNVDEIAQLSGHPVKSIKEAYRTGRELQDKYGTSMIITLGGSGALAVLPGRAYRIPVLKIPVVSTAGAGDAVLAGISAALSKGKPIEDGLRLGFAAAAAVCLTPATADCRREDVERLQSEVRLIPFRG